MPRKESGQFDSKDPVKDVSGRADDPRVIAARKAGAGQVAYAFHSVAEARAFSAKSSDLSPMAAPGGSHHVVVHATKVPALEASGYTLSKGATVKLKRKIQMYAPIMKTEKQDDGTIKVWGYASSDSKDADGETITSKAMKAALPDYLKFGAVREMHDATKAAGTAIEAEVQEDGKTWFGAHVVDPVAVLKVETGTYKGFSIGGRVTERDSMNKAQINALNLFEVSLVDRPCNPDAVITVMKREASPEDDVAELAEILDEGTVTPAMLLKAAASLLEKAEKEDAEEDDKDPKDDGEKPEDDKEPKDGKTTEEKDPAEKSATVGDLRKGMYEVGRMAEILLSLAYICESAEYEAGYEGDNSPVPAALKAWIASGAEVFRSMAAEEVDELVACLSKAKKTDGLEKSAKGLTSEAVEEMIAKAIKPVTDALEKSTAEKAELQTKVDELSKRAAPGKAFLNAVALTKGTDSVTPADGVTKAEVPPAEGTQERVLWEIKKSHRNPTGQGLA